MVGPAVDSEPAAFVFASRMPRCFRSPHQPSLNFTPRHRGGRGRAWLLGSALAIGLGLGGCGRNSDSAASPAASAASRGPAFQSPALRAQPVGAPVGDKPWIAHLLPVDLDRDGLLDLLVCEAKHNRVGWIRQVKRGEFAEQTIAENVRGPVHADAVDFDGDGDLDVLVASMGVVFPNNDKIGAVVLLENNGAQHFTPRPLLENVARVTDVRAVDLNGDRRPDLAVAQFGYDQGEIRWMENLGGGKFRSTVLSDLSGAINVCPADLDGNGTTDLVAVIAQQWEEVVLFANDGHGGFTKKTIFGSTNEDYGSSGISLCDLNRDGRMDVLYTNGDGFDYADPGARPWHGVQWLENRGSGNFQFHRIGDLAGAYSPVGADFDGDGRVDVVASSGFNRWGDPSATSLMLFHNEGGEVFSAHRLAATPTHLMVTTTGDFDGTGQPVIATGGFHAYPPFDHQSRVSLWRAEPAAANP